MSPCCSRRFTRRKQGDGDRPIFLASSTLVRRASVWSSATMRRSISSNIYFGTLMQQWLQNELFIALCRPILAHFARTCPPLPYNLFGASLMQRSQKMTEKTAQHALLSAVDRYLDMMYDGELERFDSVFAPTAQLHGVNEGQVRVLSAADYRGLLGSRPSPKSNNAPRQQEVLLI